MWPSSAAMFPVPLAFKIANLDHRWNTKILLNAIVLISLILLSPGILIYAQIKFLPYQSDIITWLHRTIVLTDIVLLWSLWPQIATPSKTWFEWLQGSRPISAIIVTLSSAFFVIIISDFPGGIASVLLPQEKLENIRNLKLLEREYNLSDRILVSEEPSPEILSVYYRTTCKTDNTYGTNSCDESTIEIGSPFWCKHAKSLQLKNRRIRNANLSNAILCSVVFENANLYDVDMSGSNLLGAQLKNADLRKANLRGINLRDAQLAKADLRDAHLWQADLRGAYLQRTNLRDTQLIGADLRNVNIEKSFEYVWITRRLIPLDLRYANLSKSNLSGVNLSGTLLHGAEFVETDLRGTNLSGSELHGANLSNADLRGANLSEATLSGANLSEADLRGVNLSGAKLHGVDLSKSDLSGANLRGSELAGVKFIETILDLTDLRNTYLLSEPNDNIIQKIEKINNKFIRENSLKRIQNAKNRSVTIKEVSSLNDAILCQMEDMYNLLKNRSILRSANQTLHIIDCEMETESQDYLKQLMSYLSGLICSDKSGHTANWIADRIFYDEKFDSELARNILSNKCPEIVEIGLKMSSERKRNRLNEMLNR